MEVVREDKRYGPSNIWVAQRVDTQTIDSILAQLRESPIREHLVSPEKLHTTLVWLKETRKFLKLLSEHCDDLDRDVYREKRDQLIKDLTVMEGRGLRVPVKGLKYAGTSRRVVVLGLEHTKDFKKSRSPFIARLMMFLGDVGVRSPKKLMESSAGLSTALHERHQPHITVARSEDPIDLPDIYCRGARVGLFNPATVYTPLDKHWHSY
jgi:hypothetical protein